MTKLQLYSENHWSERPDTPEFETELRQRFEELAASPFERFVRLTRFTFDPNRTRPRKTVLLSHSR